MSTVAINTSQNIELDYDLASLGDRIVARLIDLGVIAGYIILIMCIVSLFNSHYDTLNALMVILYLPVVSYSLISEIFMNGQSVGKRVMKIKIISINGEQASIGQYIIRWLFRIIDTDLSLGVLSVLFVALTNKAQRIGDMVAGTTAIKTTPRATLDQTLYTPVVDTNYKVTYPEVIHLKDSDIQLVKEIQNNIFKTGNTLLALQVMRKIETVLNITSQHEPVTFLYTVLSDYNYLTAIM